MNEKTEHKLTCPDCGDKMELRSSKYGLFYGCASYPRCRGAHGAHPDGAPLGTPATKVVKEARMRAHAEFDRLWKGKHMTRTEAYAWLQIALDLAPQEAHIGKFDGEQCEKLIQAVKAKLDP